MQSARLRSEPFNLLQSGGHQKYCFSDRAMQSLPYLIFSSSFQFSLFCSDYCFLWMTGRRLLFAVGVIPPTVRKAAGEPAARSLVVRWSALAQHNSRSSNCAQ